MSDFINRVRENRQERHEERREGIQERHNRGGLFEGRDRHDDGGHGRGRGHGHGHREEYGDQGYEQDQGYGSQQRRPDAYDDDGPRRPQGYGGGGGGGYTPPSGPPPPGRSGFATQGGLDRGDFATDEDINRMVSSGELGERSGRRPAYDRDEEGSYGRGGGGEGNRYGAPPGPPPGQGYSRYDAPSGAPPGRDYQRQEPQYQGNKPDSEYGSSYGRGSDRPNSNQYGSQHQGNKADSEYGSGYGRGSDRPNSNQYGSQQGESRPQGPPSSYSKSQVNTPSGGFTASRDDGDRYGSGQGGGRPGGPPRQGEADDYYGQQGQSGRDDRYAHLADIANEHGEDPETYRKATQGLHEKIQSQNLRPGQDDDGGYQSHVDAHRKAYGGDDQGPMNADAIGAAAAMEAFKQTTSGANKPSGGLLGGKPSGGVSSKQEVEEDVEDGPAGAGGRGMQDKLMALAMSQAGKLFDKKNPGTNTSGGSGGQDKAQAMQSAAATAMQLFTQYKTKGKLDSGDMSLVMGLAKNLF